MSGLSQSLFTVQGQTDEGIGEWKEGKEISVLLSKRKEWLLNNQGSAVLGYTKTEENQ